MTADVRFTVILTPAAHKRVLEATEKYKITQAELIQTLVQHYDEATFGPLFNQAHDAKMYRRGQNKTAKTLLAKLSPEELTELAETVKQRHR